MSQTVIPNMAGTYTVHLKVTDNEGDVAETDKSFYAGVPRLPHAGTDAHDDSYEEVQCPVKGASATKTYLARFSGNVQVTAHDPVATRGYPLVCNVHLNTQSWIQGKRTYFGNAAFTYGIELRKAYIGPEEHWFLIDGDGSEFDSGLTSSAPTAPAGFYGTFTADGNAWIISGAGAPEEIFRAGNFTYNLDALGRLTHVTDPSGNVQEVIYSDGHPVAVNDLSSLKSIAFEYDTGGRVFRIRQNGSAASREITYYAGDLIQSITVKNEAGLTETSTEFEYDVQGRLKKVTRDNDPATAQNITYQDAGNNVYVANISNSDGATNISYFFAPGSGYAFRTKKTTATGGVWQYDATSNGDIGLITMSSFYGYPYVVTVGHDAAHNRTSWTDGFSTYTYSYYANGKLQTISNSLGESLNFTYVGADLTSVTDNIGTLVTQTYDDPANPHSPTTITDGEGDTWTYAYNAYGQLTQVTPPAGSPTLPTTIAYYEDPLSPYYGYPQSFTDGAGRVTEFGSYTVLGDLSAVTTSPSSGVTNTEQYQYDSAQRLTTITHPDGKTYSIGYAGRDLESTVDEAGAIYEFTWCPSCGALDSETGPLSKTLAWDRNADRALTGFTDARTNTTTYSRGLNNELKDTTFPGNDKWTRVYNRYGLINTFGTVGSRSRTYTYDAARRVTKEDFSSAADTDLIYSYNADGTVATITDAGGTTTYTYTDSRQLESVTKDHSSLGLTPLQRVEYSYNPDGTLLSTTWLSGGTTIASWTYGYDGSGKVTSVANSFGETTSYAYDGEGKLTGQSNANLTSNAYTYFEPRGWPARIESAFSGTAFARYDLAYDSTLNTVGNLTGVTELSGDTMAYGYDELYRLTSETRTGGGAYTKSEGYDLANNVTTVSGSTFAVYDSANKISSLPGGTITYLNGNVRTFNAFGQNSYTIYWDTRDKITSFGSPNSTYKYNADGLRFYRLRSSVVTFYIFDGDKLIGEISGGVPTYAYTWGPDGLVSQRKLATNTSLWYHYGPQGETRQLTDTAGAVVDTYLYDAYGKQLSSTGANVNPFRYGGKVGYYTDLNSAGFVLAGQRWYSPHLMRWLSRDPIEYEGGDNLYAYVKGRPVKFVDPSGLADLTLLPSGSAEYQASILTEVDDRAERQFSIYGHSDNEGLYDTRSGGWDLMSPEQIVAEIRATPKLAKLLNDATSIRVYGCRISRKYADALAAASGKPVWRAPNYVSAATVPPRPIDGAWERVPVPGGQ